MPFIYPTTSNTNSVLNYGLYLNQTDYDLFSAGTDYDYWFSTSNDDSIELTVYDLDKNLLKWDVLNTGNTYKETILTFYDEKNNAVNYSYNELKFGQPLYKTEKILLNPALYATSSNLSDGNYIFSYQFTRYLAGSPNTPLVIKEISPSKTEIKLIPIGASTPEYEAFCLGKVFLKSISPLYLKLIKNCSYSELYEQSKIQYASDIELIKNLFFIPSDGKFVEFLKTIYEDYIKYADNTFNRTQGIKTYFNNFLISETNYQYSFDEIKTKFDEFINKRLDILFHNYTVNQYQSARDYLFNLFSIEYFGKIHTLIESSYKDKFKSPLKNALSIGSGKYIPILNYAYMDEKIYDNDPLTLLVKLQTPLTDEISIKSSVWLSNISMVPFLFNCIIKSGIGGKTIKISHPDFTISQKNVSSNNKSQYYNENALNDELLDANNINISKKISELNVDYSSLSNFVVFSSAELRHNIFKNKMIALSGIDYSLSTLESSYSSSGYSYPYYTTEKDTLNGRKTEIIDSFDGFDSYLYKTGYYVYDYNTKFFSSASYVDSMDEETKRYDKYNRDSLVNNTPEHILVDTNNDDYLIFLSMTGHYFDNLYLYIKALPSEHSVTDTNSFSNKIIQHLLTSLGWKIDASLESLDISENYLDKSLNGKSEFSADERTRQIWNRILNTLPLLYKTKGTEECIKLVLACYGIPSTLINLREYGGTDYSNTDKTSYTIDEKIFMLNYSGIRDYVEVPFDPSLKTIEFKVALDSTKGYNSFEKVPLLVKYNQYNEIDWTVGVYKEKKRYVGRAYFELEYPTYHIGIVGDYGAVNSPTTQSIKVATSLNLENPDIIITTGDNTYETGINAYDNTVGKLYHQFINPYMGISGSGADVNRFFTTIGNHDYIGGSYNQYKAFFPNTLNFYTFKKGSVQFFMLNSDLNEPSGSTSTSTQAEWLKQQITSSYNDLDIIWRVAVFHHDWISSGNPAHLAPYMEWPWYQWGLDLVITGHDHFYERLEANNIPVIVQGAGGAALYDFTNIVPESKFRYNDYHSYSVLVAKGNSLTIETYDMFGNQVIDNGAVTLPSCSIENGNFVMTKPNVPFSDRPFKQADKYILSDPIPIFNNEIFSIMVRKNDPDGLFEYSPISDLVPLKYDLRVQRKDDGRTVFDSYTSDVFTQTYNYKFSNAGTLYFGNYINSGSFIGSLDKILLWDDSITDSTYDDHCNNINSYSYTGSFIPHETLYFRMNFDYPVDLSLSNPSVIVNANEYYSSSIYAIAYNFNVIGYSSSIDNCVEVKHSTYPYQFEEISYAQTFTITSYGPNKFKNQKVQKVDLDIAARLDPNDRSTYSPNKFISPDSNQIGLFADPNDYKNRDIFRYLGDYGITELIADPMDMFNDKYSNLKSIRDMYGRSGNKKVLYTEMFTLYRFYFDRSIFETIKQLIPARNTIYTGILIEPTVLERPKYQYKQISTEAGTTNVTASISSYVLTSSFTVRPATYTLNNSVYSAGNINGEFVYVNFHTDNSLFTSVLYEHIPFFLPEGPYPQDKSLDSIYNQFLSLQSKLLYVKSGWIKKYPKDGELYNVETHDWPVPGIDSGPTGILFGPVSTPETMPGYYFTGSGYYYLKDCYFYVNVNDKPKQSIDALQKSPVGYISLQNIKLPTVSYPSYGTTIIKDIENQEELGIHSDNTGKIIETNLSGSPVRYYLRSWIRNKFYFEEGEYSKPQTVTSQSLFLYKTEIMNEAGYTAMVYTESVSMQLTTDQILSKYPYIPEYSPPTASIYADTWTFLHEGGTFKQSPNSTTNNLQTIFTGDPETLKNTYENPSIINISPDQYYEIFTGYSKHHLNKKRILFSPQSYPKMINFYVSESTYTMPYRWYPDNIGYEKTFIPIFDKYIKSKQTSDTTVDETGFSDNSLPVQSINVSNINVFKSDNVLR